MEKITKQGELEKYMLPNSTNLDKEFQRAAEALQLKPRPVLHQLRHSGPSADRAEKLRTLLEIKHRGRWMADKSVARYNKQGRINQQLDGLKDG
eukprot:9420352-Karenia_brevis.AAC.1